MIDLNKLFQSGLLEQYVLGLTSPEEQAHVESLMVEYPEVHEKVKRLRSCMEHYTGLHDIPEPKRTKKTTPIKDESEPIAKKRSLSVECKFGKPRNPIEEVRDYTRLLTGVACFFILGFAGLSIYFYVDSAEKQVRLQYMNDRLNDLEKRHFETLTHLESLEKSRQLLKDTHTRQLWMNGSQPEVKAVLYHNDQQQKSFLDPVSLPDPPANHHYEIWAEDGQRKLNLGTIFCQKNQPGLIPLQYIDNARKFILTMEPESGGEGKPILVATH